MEKKISIAELRKTVTVKSLSLWILLSIAILVGMELVSFYIMNVYEKGTVENYRNSLQTYCSYWDSRFDTINSSLFTYTGAGSSDGLFWNICYAQDELTFQTGKVELVRQMSELARNYKNEILIFSYIPDREVFLKSSNNLVGYKSRTKLNDHIRRYIESGKKNNSVKWGYFESEKEPFFIQVYKIDEGYIGALVKCSTILDGMEQGNQIISGVGLINEQKDQVAVLSGEWKEEQKDTERLHIPFEYMENDLCIVLQQKRLFSDKASMTILSLFIIVTGFALLVWNIRFQIQNVLRPLNKLRTIMENFSHGDLNVRLKESDTQNEIGVLYHAFNEMAEQIVDLKIDVYEQKLMWERIESNYLRVQIQPHFYTNILNLIYGLAQLQNFKAIQKLAMTTGAYFRYLIGEKGTFVVLREEIECVRNYIQIQQIRYKDGLEFELNIEQGVEEQMVLPLILQTFAGNSVKHNITLVPVLRVVVEICSVEGNIYILIRDNGIGFDQEVLHRINRNEPVDKSGTHIGITNVKERIRLFYGDRAKVEIESEPGRTEVKVVLPEVLSREEQDEYFISGR